MHIQRWQKLLNWSIILRQMQLSPEAKAQLAEQKKQCVICKIISKEIPGKVVFEDSSTLATLDIYPALKGHTLFFQKEHYPLMIYLPPEDFQHLFGLVPALCKAIKNGIVTTALNIFIANGGAAGQQMPHFMMHILPRDPGDGFFNFFFKTKKHVLPEDKIKMLLQNFTGMMQNYFQSNPASWHTGKGSMPAYLQSFQGNSVVLYEDEKVICLIPKDCAVQGQLEIYSKKEEFYLENLSAEDAGHLFLVASFAASLTFQVWGVQGTNVIIKSGKTDDHPSGKLCVYVFPRKEGDVLESMHWKPQQPNYDLDSVLSKLKDKTWKIGAEVKKPTSIKPEIIKITEPKKETTGKESIDSTKSKNKDSGHDSNHDSNRKGPANWEEEIRMAMDKVKNR